MADEQRSVRRARFKDSPFSDSSIGTFLPGGKSASELRLLPFALVLLAPGRGQLSFSHAGPPAVVPRGGPTPTVNLPLPPLFRLRSSCSRPAPLGVCKHLTTLRAQSELLEGTTFREQEQQQQQQC